MIYLEERIRYDGASNCFPSLDELANLRGLENIHENVAIEDKLLQLEDIAEK